MTFHSNSQFTVNIEANLTERVPMKKFVATYIAASDLLFRMRNPEHPLKNETVELFSAFDAEAVGHLDAGRKPDRETLEQVSKKMGIALDDCNRRIDIFLLWRSKSG